MAKFTTVETNLLVNGHKVFELLYPSTADKMDLQFIYEESKHGIKPQYWFNVDRSSYQFTAEDLRSVADKLDELNKEKTQ